MNLKNNIKISPLNEKEMPYKNDIEIVERKGIGHPDTICDNLSEEVSLRLSRYYYENYGYVMHHNVDKALLVGGIANPRYGGGEIVEPINISIVGRATKEIEGKKLPIEEIALETIHEWIHENIRHLDENNHIIASTNIRPGSRDLVGLFERFARNHEVPLANDTSFGVGFYPFDVLERLVYDSERLLNSSQIKEKYSFIGEDIKIMGVRNGDKYTLTVAAAIVDKYISSIKEYEESIAKIKDLLNKEVVNKANVDVEVHVNTADDYKNENIYLTVTGTSAEQGDDGQVGRGNRVNGLITPYRPMSLEAAAGKNPISHVGKLYNFFANDLSKKIVENGYGREAVVYMVSQIGKPITHPKAVNIKVSDLDKTKEKEMFRMIEEELSLLPELWKKIVLEKKYNVA